jgi:poly-gamma-glutamate synthesis protein (capsule biosynthesis protein)
MAWRALRPPLKALRLNDRLPWQSGYAALATWRLIGDPVAAATLADLLASPLAVTPPIHLVAVGDLMLARSLGAEIAAGALESPFAAFAETLRDADVAVGNLESALGTGGEPAEKRYPFLAPPQAADALALAGFDLVSLANNHAQDFGSETLLQAIDLLGAAGVSTAGAGRDELSAYAPTMLQVGDLRLAFLAYVNVPVEVSGFDTRDWTAGPGLPGLAWGEPDRVRAEVDAARQLADLVIVLLHSGYEYIEEPSEEQAALARAAAEAGADLVLGHHAHLLQGAAFGSETVVLYGLGNFAFNIDGPAETALVHVWLDRVGVRHVTLEPAVVGPNGAPRMATQAEATAIRQRFRWLTSLLPRLP